MIDKRFVESFLRLNNIDTDASLGDIKTVLTNAHWSPEEIEEALLVHTGDEDAIRTATNQKRTELFRPDMEWTSSKLSSLLGVNVVIDPKTFRMPATKKEEVKQTGKEILVGIGIALLVIVVVAGISIGLMYFFKVGPFFTQPATII